MRKGSCLCGAVTLRVAKITATPTLCHCAQCRKQTGGPWASVQVDDDALHVAGLLRWYRSSPNARRGFCAQCGGFLLWKADADTDTGVSLGVFETPTGLRVGRHIFTAGKGDYYDLPKAVQPEEQEDE